MEEILLVVSVALVVFLLFECSVDGKHWTVPKLFAHTNKKRKDVT